MDMSMFQIMADACGGLGPIVSLIKNIFKIIQIVVPILLILWGAFDLAKAVIASDDKEIKGATSKLIRRAVVAAAVFFIVTLVTVVMNLVTSSAEDADTVSWQTCWQQS